MKLPSSRKLDGIIDRWPHIRSTTIEFNGAENHPQKLPKNMPMHQQLLPVTHPDHTVAKIKLQSFITIHWRKLPDDLSSWAADRSKLDKCHLINVNKTYTRSQYKKVQKNCKTCWAGDQSLEIRAQWMFLLLLQQKDVVGSGVPPSGQIPGN